MPVKPGFWSKRLCCRPGWRRSLLFHFWCSDFDDLVGFSLQRLSWGLLGINILLLQILLTSRRNPCASDGYIIARALIGINVFGFVVWRGMNILVSSSHLLSSHDRSETRSKPSWGLILSVVLVNAFWRGDLSLEIQNLRLLGRFRILPEHGEISVKLGGCFSNFAHSSF